MPTYSKQCLVEVQEEMRALYKADEIECIFNCLQGFKVIFSFEEISQRAKTLYPGSILANETYTVLNDMYRIGVIGNYLNRNHSPRWEYKEQYKLIIDEPWKIIIHPALRIELAVNSRIDKYINKKTKPQKHSRRSQEIFVAKIEEIRDRYVLVSFTKDGCKQDGYIFMGNLGLNTVKEGTLNSSFCVGQTINAVTIGYANYISRWLMRAVKI